MLGIASAPWGTGAVRYSTDLVLRVGSERKITRMTSHCRFQAITGEMITCVPVDPRKLPAHPVDRRTGLFASPIATSGVPGDPGTLTDAAGVVRTRS
jgi:hypothetical protein